MIWWEILEIYSVTPITVAKMHSSVVPSRKHAKSINSSSEKTRFLSSKTATLESPGYSTLVMASPGRCSRALNAHAQGPKPF